MFLLTGVVAGTILTACITELTRAYLVSRREAECLGVVQRLLKVYTGITPTTPADYREGMYRLIEHGS